MQKSTLIMNIASAICFIWNYAVEASEQAVNHETYEPATHIFTKNGRSWDIEV